MNKKTETSSIVTVQLYWFVYWLKDIVLDIVFKFITTLTSFVGSASRFFTTPLTLVYLKSDFSVTAQEKR